MKLNAPESRGGQHEAVAIHIEPRVQQLYSPALEPELFDETCGAFDLSRGVIEDLKVIFTDQKLLLKDDPDYSGEWLVEVFGLFEAQTWSNDIQSFSTFSIGLDMDTISQATQASMAIGKTRMRYNPDITFRENTSVVLIHELIHLHEYVVREKAVKGRNLASYILNRWPNFPLMPQNLFRRPDEEDRVRESTEEVLESRPHLKDLVVLGLEDG
jgi:hypothetical protein